MARIRTIKPEFPQSESMGNVSRDARLTFLQLWTIADDEGRLRGNSRMLASLLFPYDDDAPSLIDGWLAELEREGCVVRYKVDGQSYLQICNWLIHQKIDKPSKSKIPAFENTREDSRNIVVGREGKGEDQGKDLTNPIGLVVAGDADDDLPGRPDRSPCPHKAIVALYHEMLPANPMITDWTTARAEVLRVRWNEDKKRQNLEWWRKFFDYVAKSEFLTGRKTGKDGRAFTPGLEWMLKAENFAKIREGRYHEEAA
jgi:hypothetical protein